MNTAPTITDSNVIAYEELRAIATILRTPSEQNLAWRIEDAADNAVYHRSLYGADVAVTILRHATSAARARRLERMQDMFASTGRDPQNRPLAA